MSAGDILRTVRTFDSHAGACRRARDGGYRCVLADDDAFGRKRVAHDGDGLRVVLRHDLLGFEHGHARTEAAEGLRQLEPDRTAADDEQMLRQDRVVEDRFVREVGRVSETRNWRHQRRRAGGDDEALRLNAGVASFDFGRPGEARVGLDDADAELLETLDGIVRLDRGDDFAHMRHDDAESRFSVRRR